MDDLTQQQYQQQLLELYCLVVERYRAEQAYNRAGWKVSYYRKIKAKLDKAPISEKRSAPIERAKKKIEIARLWNLQKYKELVEVRERLGLSITRAKNTVCASFTYCANGKVEGIWLPAKENNGYSKELNMDQIVEIVEQHEANTILTEALKDTEV